MTFRIRSFLLSAVLVAAIGFTGCETTADPELKRAEKALNEALAIGADASASEDYMKAEAMLIEAQELARDNKILEARQMAVEAKVIADDAKTKAQEQAKILEEEAGRLGK